MSRRCAAPLLAAAAAVLLLVVGAAATAPGAVPAADAVRAQAPVSDAWLLDRHGEPVQRQRVDLRARRLEWVPLADVSPALIDMVLAAEDRRFRDHAGVDWGALAAGAVAFATGRGTRGASTITMQLAGILDPALAPEGGRRSIRQKIRQIRAARALEQDWSKDRILEAWLNRVPFRGELEGVAAASQGLFGKAPHALDRFEAAVLAALVRSPSAAPGRVAARACALLAAGADRCAALRPHVALALGRAHAAWPAPDLAPHVARRLLRTPGEQVVSSLDAGLQRAASELLQRHLAELAERNVEDGAVVVLDNASGEVLVWVGSSGRLSDAAEVDAALALRQPGSTLKPFLYALALEQRRLSAASLLDDSPLRLATATGLYIPRNYTEEHRGPVSVRQALAGSMNIPAVRALVLTGTDALVARLRELGLTSLVEDGDYYGYSLALGSADVTLVALTNAYRALANGGVSGAWALQPVSAPAHGRRVMDPAAAFIVTDILADRAARTPVFGLANPLELPFWAAVKTGTSKDMRDNWCIGFSARFTVGVWVGNASGESMHDVSGVSGAAPVWRDVMLAAHRATGARSQPPRPPRGVIAVRVRFAGGIEPERTEYFLPGTERERVELATDGDAPAVIVYPPDGTVIALDPDIPLANQRVVLQVQGAPHGGHWTLDGETIAPATGNFAWIPIPGRHAFAIVDAGGRVLDAVRIDVRGLPAPPGGTWRREAEPAIRARS